MRIELGEYIPLDEKLNTHIDPETGRVRLTGEQAKDLLLRALLHFYMPDERGYIDPRVQVLVEIAYQGGEWGQTFDFTEMLEQLKKEQEESAELARNAMEKGTVITPPSFVETKEFE